MIKKRLSNNTSSNIKTNMINTDQFTHIFDSINVSSPMICFQKSTNNIYHIECERLDINIESYFSTSHITYYGIWKNNNSFPIDSIFILPYYSNINIIQCTINSQNVLRTTSILKHKHNKKLRKISEETKTSNIDDYNNEKNKNSWSAQEMGLFSHQIDGQFRVPMFNLASNHRVIVKIKFIQTLYNDGIHGYRLRLPLQFYHAKYPKYRESMTIDNNSPKTTITRTGLQLTKWSQYVTLKCNIYYPQKLSLHTNKLYINMKNIKSNLYMK